jgi:hypothetical protein
MTTYKVYRAYGLAHGSKYQVYRVSPTGTEEFYWATRTRREAKRTVRDLTAKTPDKRLIWTHQTKS